MKNTKSLLLSISRDPIRSAARVASSVAVVAELKVAASDEQRATFASPCRVVAFGGAVCDPAAKEFDLYRTKLQFMIGDPFLSHRHPLIGEMA